MNTKTNCAMNANHTPGPWEVTSNGGVIHPEAIYAPNGKGVIIAITLAVTPEPIRKANAALIASAPSLLAQRDELRVALKLCEDVIGMARLQGKLSDNALSPVNDALVAARTALAKSQD